LRHRSISRNDRLWKVMRWISLGAGDRQAGRRNGDDLGQTASDPGSGRAQQ
jgi:hypothetical protein